MLFGTWSQAHAYDPSDYMETNLHDFYVQEECAAARRANNLNFYVKRTVHTQDFGAKVNLTYHNGAHVADILK